MANWTMTITGGEGQALDDTVAKAWLTKLTGQSPACAEFVTLEGATINLLETPEEKQAREAAATTTQGHARRDPRIPVPQRTPRPDEETP